VGDGKTFCWLLSVFLECDEIGVLGGESCLPKYMHCPGAQRLQRYICL
jgi:hypothetical protein